MSAHAKPYDMNTSSIDESGESEAVSRAWSSLESALEVTRHHESLIGQREKSALHELRLLDLRLTSARLTLSRADSLASAACGSDSGPSSELRWATAERFAKGFGENSPCVVDSGSQSLLTALNELDGICDQLMADLAAGPKLAGRVERALRLLEDAENDAKTAIAADKLSVDANLRVE